MKIIEIEISNQKERAWLYYLRKRYSTKRGGRSNAGLKRLIKYVIVEAVKEEAQKELDNLNENT